MVAVGVWEGKAPGGAPVLRGAVGREQRGLLDGRVTALPLGRRRGGRRRGASLLGGLAPTVLFREMLAASA